MRQEAVERSRREAMEERGEKNEKTEQLRAEEQMRQEAVERSRREAMEERVEKKSESAGHTAVPSVTRPCTLTGHSKPVYSAAYSPDGKHVASAWGDTTGATGDNGCLERWVRDSVGKSLSERRAHVCTTPCTASATARARRQQQICVSAPRAHLSLLFLLLLPSVATAQPCGPAHISVRTPADLRADLRPAKHHSSSSRLGHTS